MKSAFRQWGLMVVGGLGSLVAAMLGGFSSVWIRVAGLLEPSVLFGPSDRLIIDTSFAVVVTLAGFTFSAVRALRESQASLGAVETKLEQLSDSTPKVIRQEFAGALSRGLLSEGDRSGVAAEMFELGEAVAIEARKWPQSATPIHVCLIRGVKRRYQKVAQGLHTNGSFMDSEERLELALELVAAHSAYAVVMFGVADINEDANFKWHVRYKQGIREFVERKVPCGWVFVHREPEGRQWSGVAKAVSDLGLPCFHVHLPRSEDELASSVVQGARDHGHLLEVFSPRFSACLHAGRTMRAVGDVVWKSTALLRVRPGKPAEQVFPGDEGVDGNVWADDSYRKRVRAGTLSGDQNLPHFLQYVLRERQAVDRSGRNMGLGRSPTSKAIEDTQA